eukprot:gene6238-6878_t
MRLNVLPKKCKLLVSENLQEQVEAVVYFRRILALDRNPPLAAISETGIVFPQLVHFLSRYDCPKLQHEAAWCLTNIACGDIIYIQQLIDYGVIPSIMDVIHRSTFSYVKEQALWALCNLSNEISICYILRHEVNYLKVIFAEIGIDYLPIESRNCVGQYGHVYVQHGPPMQDNPALSSMRHVTMILGLLVRSCKEPLEVSFLHAIHFAYAELLQSPDEEILQDICDSIVYLSSSSSHPITIPLALEYGLLSRLLEVYPAYSNCKEE